MYRIVENFDGGKFWWFWRFPARPSKFNPSNFVGNTVFGKRHWPSVKIFSVKYLKSQHLSKFPPIKISRYTIYSTLRGRIKGRNCALLSIKGLVWKNNTVIKLLFLFHRTFRRWQIIFLHTSITLHHEWSRMIVNGHVHAFSITIIHVSLLSSTSHLNLTL